MKNRIRQYCNNDKMDQLPIEVVVNILLRLPVKSLCCIQCVSKTLSNMVDCLSFATLHTSRLLAATNVADAAQVPQLMLLARCDTHTGKNGYSMDLQSVKYDGNAFATTKHPSNILSKTISFPQYHSNIGCVFSNLCCFGYKDRCFIFNPLRSEVLRLPIPNHSGQISRPFTWYGMGFDDKTKTYKIVGVSWDVTYTFLAAQVYVLGTSSWREIRSAPPEALSEKNVYACGHMHWLTLIRKSGRSNIISFDFKTEEFSWTPHPNLACTSWGSSLHLLNKRGCLAIVDTYSDECIEIWVLKNHDKKEWILDYKIDNLMPLIGIFGNCGEWEHGIFFTKYRVNMRSQAVFLDQRCGSMKRVKFPKDFRGEHTSFGIGPRIFSYTLSMISLKHFGNVVEAKAGEWHID